MFRTTKAPRLKQPLQETGNNDHRLLGKRSRKENQSSDTHRSKRPCISPPTGAENQFKEPSLVEQGKQYDFFDEVAAKLNELSIRDSTTDATPPATPPASPQLNRRRPF